MPYYYKSPNTLTNQGTHNLPLSSTLELWEVLTWPSKGIWPTPHRCSLLGPFFFVLFVSSRSHVYCAAHCWFSSIIRKKSTNIMKISWKHKRFWKIILHSHFCTCSQIHNHNFLHNTTFFKSYDWWKNNEIFERAKQIKLCNKLVKERREWAVDTKT